MSELTANQKYKESKTELSFKEWLKNEQDNGVLPDHETMFNYDGIEDELPKKKTTKKAKSSMLGLNILGIVAIGTLVYGLSQMSNANGE
jgi:hypothetical protein